MPHLSATVNNSIYACGKQTDFYLKYTFFSRNYGSNSSSNDGELFNDGEEHGAMYPVRIQLIMIKSRF